MAFIFMIYSKLKSIFSKNNEEPIQMHKTNNLSINTKITFDNAKENAEKLRDKLNIINPRLISNLEMYQKYELISSNQQNIQNFIEKIEDNNLNINISEIKKNLNEINQIMIQYSSSSIEKEEDIHKSSNCFANIISEINKIFDL